MILRFLNLFATNGINLGSVLRAADYRNFDYQKNQAFNQIQILRGQLESTPNRESVEQGIIKQQATIRKLSKSKLYRIVEYLKNKTNEIEDNILRSLFNHYVNEHYQNEDNYNRLQTSIGRALN